MKKLTGSDEGIPLFPPVSRLFIAGFIFIAMLLGMTGLAQAVPSQYVRQNGEYVLVKTEIDESKLSKSGRNDDGNSYSTKMTANSLTSDSTWVSSPNGTPINPPHIIHVDWSFNSPPSKIGPEGEFFITATGRVSTTDKDQPAYGQFDIGGDILQVEDGNRINISSDRQPTASKRFRFKAPTGPAASKKFSINILGNFYYYEWRAGAVAPKSQLKARLDVGTMELVRDKNGDACHIIISGWIRNTSKPVEVIFPKQSDGFGSQDKGGKTGIVVPIGQGTVEPFHMSGARGPNGSYGKEYQWTLIVRARSTAPVGTQLIPIIVRQAGAGQVKLSLRVRSLGGRTRQVGARQDGEGAVTGPSGPTVPPITTATSATGLRARLETGTLVLTPGQTGRSCTIFIKGWRNRTSDQVEILLPQQDDSRGNLDNDLVAFPGSGKMDPANMFQNANGEYPYGLSFRAMERAPGVTTMIEIIVRQKGHEDVRLLLQIRVQATAGANRIATGNPPPPVIRTQPKSGTSGITGNRPPVRPNPPSGNVTQPGITMRPGTPTLIIPNGPQDHDNGNQPLPPSHAGEEAFQAALKFDEAEDWPKAEAEYRRAVRLAPKLEEGWDNLGDVCGKQNKWGEAEKAFQEAVRLQPEESYYYAQLALAQLKQNRRDEATKNAKTALRLGLEDHEVFDELGLHGGVR